MKKYLILFLVIAFVTSMLFIGTGCKEEVPLPEEVVEEEEQEEQAKAPTITLEIYQGSTYSSEDDLCYYRVEAIVTGTPTPDVEFSKDDSNGALGKLKVQVNIKDPADNYTLTATATNSEGSASDSIYFSWRCRYKSDQRPREDK